MSDSPDSNIDYGHTLNVTRAHSAVAREKGEHTLGDAPLSLWALLPISLVLIIGGAFFDRNAVATPNVGGYHAPTEMPPGIGDSIRPAVDPYSREAWLAAGKSLYSANCAVCHQASGEGLAGQFPPLKDSEYVIHGEKRPSAILLLGLVGPVTVNGKAYNGAMPAQGTLKTPKEIAQIVSYIRNEWGNTGSLVYDDQITALKAELGSRSTSYTEAEVKAIPEEEHLPPSKHGGETVAPADSAAAVPAPADAAAPAAAPTP